MSDAYDIGAARSLGPETVSLTGRAAARCRQADFATPFMKQGPGIAGLLDSLPHILAGDSLRAVVDAIAHARANAGKPVIWGMGGHVIKCGLAPVLIDLMRRGFATAFAMNGSASIHDFEIALAGTPAKTWKRCCRTGASARPKRPAANGTARSRSGWTAELGEALGRALERLAPPKHAPPVCCCRPGARACRVTVHVAIGTDTPHTHPAAESAALGAATHRDFRLFCTLVAELNDGGVYINAGSAVVMPEVFLKAVSARAQSGP